MCLLFIFFNLAGKINIMKEEEIIENITEKLVQMIDNKPEIYLQINTDEFSRELNWVLKEKCFKKNISITENRTNVLSLEVNYIREEKKKEIKRLIFKTQRNFTEHKFMAQLKRDNEIIDFKTFTYAGNKQTEKEMKWYDPIIVSSIIGGLVYLFYYGNQ